MVFHESFLEEEISWIFQGCFMIFKGVYRVFQGSFKKSFLLHGTHRSFPSRRRACFQIPVYGGFLKGVRRAIINVEVLICIIN